MNKVIDNKKSKDLSPTGKMCFNHGAINNRGMGSAAEKTGSTDVIRASKGLKQN